MIAVKGYSRLKVAQVTECLGIGGLEQLLVEMARHRNAARFDWTVIVLGERGPLAEPLEQLGVRVIALREADGIRPRLWLRLARLFAAERFDVIHAHNDRPLVYAMPAAWWAKTPRRIYTHHHGKLGELSLRQRMLFRQAARCVHEFVCVSRDSERYVVEERLRARVQTVWNGIDLRRFAFQGPTDNGPIVTVARLSPEKDIANLLRAARHVVSDYPEARFEIAGDGKCRDECVRLAAELGISEHVMFLGERRDIPAILARSRLFVLPSQTEGISLTLLEAMARGLPIVTTDVGGNPEVVIHSVTGLLVPARDEVALANGIKSVLADPEQGRRMGCAGRKRVEDQFEIQQMTERYEALYESSNALCLPSHNEELCTL